MPCRLGRVIAWLEAMAGDALDRAKAAAVAAGGSGMRFARNEALPNETRLRLAERQQRGGATALGFPGAAVGADAASMVTELDPDAPTRCAPAC